jgi:hypothetical protein
MHDHEEPTDEHDVSRRSMIAGLGVLGGGLALGAAIAGPAAAQDGDVGTTSTNGPSGRASTVGSTIASPPVAGVTYQFRALWDFTCESASAVRTWTSNGMYAGTAGTTLWTTVELPAGAVLYDIEWYARNAKTTSTATVNRIWTAGSNFLNATPGETTIAANASSVQAFRTVVASDNSGPYPHGTRLMLGLYTPSDGTVTVNGVRVGFKPGPLGLSLLPSPVRVYDSRSGDGALTPDTTRSVSLASAVPAGATGALLSLTIVGTVGSGSLRVGAGGSTPVAPAARWGATGDSVTTPVNTAVNAGRLINVKSAFSTGNTDFVVDVLGFYS